MTIKLDEGGTRRRVCAVERDPRGGWIARNVHTGAIYPSDDWRWSTRDGAWHAAWEARMLGAPNVRAKQKRPTMLDGRTWDEAPTK